MEARLARRVLAHSASWKEKERKLDSKDTIFKQPADGLLKGQYWQRYINDKNKDNPRRLRTHLFFWGGGELKDIYSSLFLIGRHLLLWCANISDWLPLSLIGCQLPLSLVGCHYRRSVAIIFDSLLLSLIGCLHLWLVATFSEWLL